MADLYRVNSGLVHKDGKLALGCNCCGPGCTDDGTLYGLLQPCSDQIDCDGNPVSVPCLVLAMAVLPPILPGQKYFIYGTCYTLNAANLTRCQIDPLPCGGRFKNYAKVPAEDIEVISAACTDEICLPGRVAEYAVNCNGDVLTDVKYCGTAECSVRDCVVYGRGPVARLLPGEQAVRTIPTSNQIDCCECAPCRTGSIPNGPGPGGSPGERCCCGREDAVCTFSLLATRTEFNGLNGTLGFQRSTSTGQTNSGPQTVVDFSRVTYSNGQPTEENTLTNERPAFSVCAGAVIGGMGFGLYVESFVRVLNQVDPTQNPSRNATCNGWSDSIRETRSGGDFGDTFEEVTLSFSWSCPADECTNGCGGGSAAALPAGVGFAGLLPV